MHAEHAKASDSIFVEDTRCNFSDKIRGSIKIEFAEIVQMRRCLRLILALSNELRQVVNSNS